MGEISNRYMVLIEVEGKESLHSVTLTEGYTVFEDVRKIISIKISRPVEAILVKNLSIQQNPPADPYDEFREQANEIASEINAKLEFNRQGDQVSIRVGPYVINSDRREAIQAAGAKRGLAVTFA